VKEKMASKEQTSWSRKRSFDKYIEIDPEFPIPRAQKTRKSRSAQIINEKGNGCVKDRKANPKIYQFEVDSLNNEKNLNQGLKAESGKRKEYFESKSETTKSVKQGLEIFESKLKPFELGNLLVKEKNGQTKIPLSHSHVKLEPVDDDENKSEMINPVVKSDMIADEYQIKTDKCMKKEVKLESMGILETKVKIEPFEIENCLVNVDTSNKIETDVDERKLFVGGLPNYANESDIQDYFNKFGEIEEITLKVDQFTGRSRGFAFVAFKTDNGFAKAFVNKSHVILGKDVTVKKAESKQGKIYVGKIPDKISSEEIKSHFSKFGKITLFKQPVDIITKKGKDFCFVTFEKESSAKRLIEKGVTIINGVQINVKKVTPPSQQVEHHEMQVGCAFKNWFIRPMPFLGPRPFFGPGPFFGGWHNFGPRPFGH